MRDRRGTGASGLWFRRTDSKPGGIIDRVYQTKLVRNALTGVPESRAMIDGCTNNRQTQGDVYALDGAPALCFAVIDKSDDF